MSNCNGFSKESLELIWKIRSLDFIAEAHTLNSEALNKRNFKTTLKYQGEGKYCFEVNYKNVHYKILIEINENRPNSRYEKKIKKLF